MKAKGLRALWLSFLVFPCGASAQTNYISIPTNEYRLVPGYVILNTLQSPTRALKTTGSFPPSWTWTVYTRVPFGSTWIPSIPTAPTGHGLIVNRGENPSGNVYFPDVLPDPVLPLDLPAGFSLVCCQTNGLATFETMVGRAPDPGSQVYRLRPGPDIDLTTLNETNYFVYTFNDGIWSPEVPVAGIGEAVWIFQPAVISNPQVVGEHMSFDALLPVNAGLDVESACTVDGSDPWLVLTNFSTPVYGGTTNVVDDRNIHVSTQRFYRLKLSED